MIILKLKARIAKDTRTHDKRRMSDFHWRAKLREQRALRRLYDLKILTSIGSDTKNNLLRWNRPLAEWDVVQVMAALQM